MFCAVFLIISFAFATLNSVFYNKDIYENIVTDDYVEYMHDYIENALTYEAEYYQIEPDYFTDYINDSEIERYSKEYYLRVYAVLSGNKETEPTPFSSDEYKKGILEFEKRIEKDGYDFADEAVDEIAKEAAALSQTSCESISEKYLQAVGNITSNSKFKTIVKSYYICACNTFCNFGFCNSEGGQTKQAYFIIWQYFYTKHGGMRADEFVFGL